jgi:hypothetical protein
VFADASSSHDVLMSDDVGEPMVEVEFLHTQRPSGAPEHNLQLKPNCPIMLLRNLDPSRGLCNGTRLIAIRLTNNSKLLVARIASGSRRFIGRLVLLPRIVFVQDKSELGFTWHRTQFPVKVAFAMTVNKSQGTRSPQRPRVVQDDRLRRARGGGVGPGRAET